MAKDVIGTEDSIGEVQIASEVVSDPLPPFSPVSHGSYLHRIDFGQKAGRAHLRLAKGSRKGI